MPGERFSRVYLHPGDPELDSSRARHRVGALFGESIFNHQAEQLAAYLGRELGVPVPGAGRHRTTGVSSFESVAHPIFSTRSP